MDDLKPCPFCGELPTVWAGSGYEGFATFYVECRSDVCDVTPCVSDDNKYEAIRLWNKRLGEE